MTIEWLEQYHDSKAWLTAKITDGLIVSMYSWGPYYCAGGRYDKLKSWCCVLRAAGGGPIVYWNTNDRASRDVTDEEAKSIAIDFVDRWLREELESLSEAAKIASSEGSR